MEYIGSQELFAFPLKDEKNNVTGVIEYVRDITEKKKLEELLKTRIEKLRLKGESCKYINLLEKSLKELTSSFGAKLTKKESKLTSREIEIYNMIKNGLESKEIADLLNISPRTIEKHRARIRKKLGVTKKEVHLISFLKTL